MKISFVILHYNTLEDTRKCVTSIKKHVNEEKRDIIIVDNCSPNGSGKVLEEEYKHDDVKVIRSQKNLGFARGNNIGFIYAKKYLSPDFIVLLNNDTYLIDDNFYDLVVEEYKNSNFAILGPRILTPDGRDNSNPMRVDLPTLKECKSFIFKVRLQIILNHFYCDSMYKKIVKLINKNGKKTENLSKKRMENCQLHGCFLIFSREYINLYDGLNEETFMYGEEVLLFLRARKNKLLTVYSPPITIFHNEQGATKKSMSNRHKRRLFQYKNYLTSELILYRELKKYYSDNQT